MNNDKHDNEHAAHSPAPQEREQPRSDKPSGLPAYMVTDEEQGVHDDAETQPGPSLLGEALAQAERGSQDVMTVAPDGTTVVTEAAYEEDVIQTAPTLERPLYEAEPEVSVAAAGRLDSPAWSYTTKEAPSEDPADSKPMPAPDEAASSAARQGKKSFFRKKSAPKQAPAAPSQKQAFPPFFASHPVLGVEQSLPPSAGSRIFSALALFPLLPLTLMLLLQAVFSLNARDLWFPDEIAHARGVSAMIASGALVPMLNGLAENATPLYYWFLRGLAFVVPTEGPMLHFTAAALSALLFLWAALGLGRLAARVDGRSNLAAGILLLGTGSVMGLIHYGNDIMLFAALITASHIFLYRALVSPRPEIPGMAIAFALAAMAALVKGPVALGLPCVTALLFALWRGDKTRWLCVILSLAALLWGLAAAWQALPLAKDLGLVPADAQRLPELWLAALLGLPALLLLLTFLLCKSLRLAAALSLLLLGAAFALGLGLPGFALPDVLVVPLLAVVLLLLWQITPQRPFRADFFIGLGVGLLLLGLWFGFQAWQDGSLEGLASEFLNIERLTSLAQNLRQGVQPLALVCVLFFFLPWSLLLVCLPWQRIFTKETRAGLKASRLPEKEGLAFLWCMVLAAPLLALFVHGSVFDVFAASLAPLCLIAGRAALGLSGKQAWLFRYGMALFCFVCGLLSIIGALMLFDVLPLPSFIGLPAWILPTHGGFFVVGAILLVVGALVWVGLSSCRPEGVLLMAALASTALGFPLGSLVMPSFDAVLSPKKQALMLRAYIDKDYSPALYGVPSVVHAFYTRQDIPAVKAEDIQALADKGNLVLAASLEDWKNLENKPDCLAEVEQQWIGRSRHVLLACPPIADLTPAPPPYTAAPDLLEEARKHLDLPAAFAPDKPAEEAPVEAPAEVPAPTEVPAEAPAETPEEVPVEDPAPAEAPVEEPVEDPAPVEAPAEVPVPDETPPAEAPVEAPAPTEVPVEAPAETPVEEVPAPAETPEEAPAEAPVEEPAPAPVESEDAPAEEPAPDADKTDQPAEVTPAE